MREHARHLGIHLNQMGLLPGGGSFGNYTEGNLTAFFDAIGIRPRDFAPAARPIVTLKRQQPLAVDIPEILTVAAREAVELGCILNVQEIDHNPQYPGPTAGLTEAEWVGSDLNGMMNQLDAWLTEIGAHRRRVLLSYGNERDMGAEDPEAGSVWNGQPGSTDPDGEWFHREAAFMEAARDRLGCLPAFGSDASEVGQLRSLPQRLEVFRQWGVTPAAMLWHGYGSGGHHAVHLRLLRRTARRAGFHGRLVGAELARRVDTSAGNEADRDKSAEWWRLYAAAAQQYVDVGICFFMLTEVAAVSQMVTAFRAPVPTGIATGPDRDLVAQKAWGIQTALLPDEDRSDDVAGAIEAVRAAREAR